MKEDYREQITAEEIDPGEEEVEVLGVDSGYTDAAESEIEVEVVAGNDFSGEEVSFVNLDTDEDWEGAEEPDGIEVIEDVFTGDVSDDAAIL